MAAVENKELLERITELGERSAMGTGIEIVEIQLKGAGKARLLRVYIDKPGGVTHGDCELISHRFGKLLDEEDPIAGEQLHSRSQLTRHRTAALEAARFRAGGGPENTAGRATSGRKPAAVGRPPGTLRGWGAGAGSNAGERGSRRAGNGAKGEPEV